MEKINNYIITQKIKETDNLFVYQAHQDNENNNVIIKVIKKKNQSISEIARFNHEYRLIKELNHNNIIKVHDFFEHGESFAIITEPFYGISLKEYIYKKITTIEEFLNIAIQLSEGIGYIHQHNLIHREINSNNIIINEKTLSIKISDFGILNEFIQKDSKKYDPEYIKGTLNYISPEQTGRMNQDVDYRTDIYSMGITFYEILTQSLPFYSKDPMKIIHSHIARNPKPLVEVNEKIPQIISDIVLKSLEKPAEERYQNSYGLKADLEKCRKNLKTNGNIKSFELAKKDSYAKFKLPQIVVGRDKEILTMLKSFRQVCKGNKEIMMVSGHPGIGKTSLILEVHKPIVKMRGYFISGKHEQYRRDVPYSSIKMAFTELIEQILVGSDRKIQEWRDAILREVGNSGKVITDAIPLVKRITGEQPELPTLGVEETQNRFNLFFKKFIKVFARKEHPLVIFIDDLQWADAASLNLLKNVFFDDDMANMFFIGSYRDNEVSESHPLAKLLKELDSSNVKLESINLEPLTSENVNEFVSSFLRSSKEESVLLSQIVNKKTGGNPFFINQFMKILYDEGYLKFDLASGWMWEDDKIRNIEISDSIAELMVEKIKSLNEKTKNILLVCSCIGNRFDLKFISKLLEEPIIDVLDYLSDAIEKGMLQRLGDIYKFHHVQIHEVAYSLLPEQERTRLHYKIGKLILKDISQNELKDKILFITDHLNNARSLITSEEEKIKLAEFNLMAGENANTLAAYELAWAYFDIGIDIFNEIAEMRENSDNKKSIWDDNYEIVSRLYINAVDSANILAKYTKMYKLTEVAFKKSRDMGDRIPVYCSMIKASIARNDLWKSIDIGYKVLNKLGLKMVLNPGYLRIYIIYLRIRFYLLGRSVESLENLPDNQDVNTKYMFDILSTIAASSYLVSPTVAMQTFLNFVLLSLRHGIGQPSAFSFASFCLILVALGKIDLAYRFGRLSLKLSKRKITQDYTRRVHFTYYTMVHHWKKSVKETLPALMENYDRSMELGDYETAAFSLMIYSFHSFYSGINLNEISDEISGFIKIVSKLNQKTPLIFLKINHQVILNMLEGSSNNIVLEGNSYNENDGKRPPRAFNFFKMMLCYMFDEYEEALKYSIISKKNLMTSVATVNIHQYYFYDSLIRIALYDKEGKKNKKGLLRRIKKNQNKLKSYSKYAPMNFEHKYKLVQAEILRINGKERKARLLYDESIKMARENEYLHEEGIANECAARFWISQGQFNFAGIYLKSAYSCYSDWGARAKLAHFEKRYSKYMNEKKNKFLFDFKESKKSDDEVDDKKDGTIDLKSIIKTSQVIATEIDLDKLIESVMRITMENAGAQSGVFIIKEDDEKFYVESVGDIDTGVEILNKIPIEDYEDISLQVINYVRKTMENVVLHDAANDSRFMNDPYILKKKSKSIISIPIIHKGEISGIIFLENNLTKNVFTHDRISILQVITAYAAVSLENSHLLAERERENIKLSQLDKIKDEFLANTTHELRTPLHGIIGISQFLLDGLSKRTIDEIRDKISLISVSGMRLLHLVDDILDYSKINNQDVNLVKTSVDIHVVCDIIIELLNPVVSNKKLKIINKIKPDIPLVHADEERLQQIFINLMQNAIKFTHEGSITVNAKKIVSDNDENMIKIFISDTGIGIPTDKQEAIFNKFEQVDGSVSREYEGAGLGLSIVKQLVKLHNGKIWLESEPGHGSTFYFTIPIAKNQTQIKKDEKSIIKKLNRELLVDTVNPIIPINQIIKNGLYDSKIEEGVVLAVDDDVVNLEILKFYFKDTKYSLISISTPAEIFDVIRENKIDCILLDIMMPQVSGYDVCRQLREDYNLFELPIIMLTAKNTVDDLIAAFNAGANDYVTKPVTREELLVRVKTLITMKYLIHEHDEMKYKILQNRMSPHYLFNVLNSINGYIDFDLESAEEALMKLGETYQFLVTHSEKNTISFDEEWSFMKNFLDIEQLMFKDDYTITINKEGDFSNVLVPPLVLQPIVENIFKHAFNDVDYVGEIKIEALKKGDSIEISIIDNGVGFSSNDIFSRSLGNIKNRIRHYYKNAQIIAENRTPPEKGAMVMIIFSVDSKLDKE